MEGKEVAVYVRKHFCQELVNNVSYKQNNVKSAVIENFLKMDEIMVESSGKIELRNEAKISKEEEERNSEKSEKNKQDKIYVANAGDSRAVLCKNGVAYPLSIDHKPDLDSEKNRIYKAEGWVTDGRVKGIE